MRPDENSLTIVNTIIPNIGNEDRQFHSGSGGKRQILMGLLDFKDRQFLPFRRLSMAR
jgi:hypothetical protein